MSDTFRARLTGVIRDYAADSAFDRDPYCEMEAEVLDQAFAEGVDTIAVRVVTPAGVPVPWYAAALHFFNTLNFSTAAGGATGDRVYTLANGGDYQPVAVTIRTRRDFLGSDYVCVEIPQSFTFQAFVMGVASPTPGALDPDTAQSNTNRGPGVVFPGEFAWLMVTAPDGSTYGATKDGANTRIPFGHYTQTFNSGTPVDGGNPVRELRAGNAKQGLQPYTPVLCTNYAPEDFAGEVYNSEFLGFWEITPADRPDAHIVRFQDSDGATALNLAPGRIVTWLTELDIWDVAKPSSQFSSPISVTSPLQKFGVALWNDGVAAPGTGVAAIVVWGRFWLSPEAVPLQDHATYYLKPDTLDGEFTTEQPSNGPCHRPIFRHITAGWCVMIDSEPSQHLAWAYQGEPNDSGGTPEDRLAEVVFDSFPSSAEAEGVLRYRDRPNDESADLASGEVEAEQAERNDVMAWFVGDNGVHRAMVVKRLDMIFDSGSTDVTGGIQGGSGSGWYDDPDRPGVLAFFYRAGTRITDDWNITGGGVFDQNANHMARIWAKPGLQGDSDRGGVIELTDSNKTVAEWFVHPSLTSGGGTTPDLTDPDDRKRKWAWYMSVEHWGWDLEWKLNTNNDITEATSSAGWTTGVIIQQEDIYSVYANSTPLQAVLAASRAAAFPLKVRELTICDDTDTVHKIAVICSDMYD